MPMYHYEAKDRTGKTVVGSMTAADEGSVRARLAQNGYTPLLVEGPGGPGPAATPPATLGATSMGSGYTSAVKTATSRTMGRRSVLVPNRDLSQFYRQMASMLKSGVPLPQAITQILTYTRNKTLRAALEDIEATVARGRPISEALDRHPRAFSAGHVGLIRSGEGAGFLDRAFSELANQTESDWGVQAAMKFNPLLFIIKMVGIPFLVMWAVFMSGLPHWQQHPEYIGGWLIRGAIAAAGAFVLVIVFLPTLSYLVRKSPIGRAMDGVTAGIPGIGSRRRRVDRVKTLGSLSSALAAGVPLSIAWELAAEAADSDRFQRVMRDQIPLVRQGASIPDVMGSTGLFTPQIMQMAQSGEMSGNLPEMLQQATVFEREEAKHIGNLMPWVIAVLAYLVFLVVAGYFVVTMAGNVYGGIVNSQ